MTEAVEAGRRSLLAVLAHPDDESFGPGGTLACYAAQENTEVWLVCGTDGDAGTVDAEMLSGYVSTAQLRAAELCCAAQILGLKGIDWYGYRDSGMAGSPDNQHPKSLYQAPMEVLVGRIVASIRDHRPQVIVCDNQFGGYGHPDHIKMHQATVRAFRAAGDRAQYPDAGPAFQPQRLYFTAFTPGLLKLAVRMMPLVGRDPHKFGRNHDIDLAQIVRWETPVHARLDVRPYLETKNRASACHRSQGGPRESFRGIPRFVIRRLMGFETFTAVNRLPGRAIPSNATSLKRWRPHEQPDRAPDHGIRADQRRTRRPLGAGGAGAPCAGLGNRSAVATSRSYGQIVRETSSPSSTMSCSAWASPSCARTHLRRGGLGGRHYDQRDRQCRAGDSRQAHAGPDRAAHPAEGDRDPRRAGAPSIPPRSSWATCWSSGPGTRSSSTARWCEAGRSRWTSRC